MIRLYRKWQAWRRTQMFMESPEWTVAVWDMQQSIIADLNRSIFGDGTNVEKTGLRSLL